VTGNELGRPTRSDATAVDAPAPIPSQRADVAKTRGSDIATVANTRRLPPLRRTLLPASLGLVAIVLAACSGGSDEPDTEEQAAAPADGVVATDQAAVEQATEAQAVVDPVAGQVTDEVAEDDADAAAEESLPRVPIRLDRSEIFDLLHPAEQLDPGLILIVEERYRIAEAQRARGEEPEPPPEIPVKSTTDG